MNNPLDEHMYDICHRCGTEGVFLENFFDGENFDYHYECSCEDCTHTNGEHTLGGDIRIESNRQRKRPMKDIIDVIVELSRMQGQAIDRAQAGLINTAVETAHDKWQTEKQKDNE